MTIKKISKIQPQDFKFSNENLLNVENELKKYPKNKKSSAVIAIQRKSNSY